MVVGPWDWPGDVDRNPFKRDSDYSSFPSGLLSGFKDWTEDTSSHPGLLHFQRSKGPISLFFCWASLTFSAVNSSLCVWWLLLCRPCFCVRSPFCSVCVFSTWPSGQCISVVMMPTWTMVDFDIVHYLSIHLSLRIFRHISHDRAAWFLYGEFWAVKVHIKWSTDFTVARLKLYFNIILLFSFL